MTQCWWLYLLACRDGRTYAGIATDVAARFAAHSSGKGAKFTRSNPPVRVLGTQSFASKSEALKAEAALKKLRRTEKLLWARKCPPLLSITEGGNGSGADPSLPRL
jgi:putative endonuclease